MRIQEGQRSTPTVSQLIAEWVKATDYESISGEVRDIAKRSILDFAGVALAGSRQPIAQTVKKYLNEDRCAGHSTVIGLGIKTSRSGAAFGNGVIGHCLDYDDTLIPREGGGGHFTATILPAALAVGEKKGSTGKELIEAFILGWEVCYRIGCGVDPPHYLLGWHATGTLGIFGAVVAVSKLLGLNCEQTANALGVAASEASGLRENFGTMTKPFHAGQASAKGVQASLLARLGFNSSKTAFEGKAGFCNVLSRDPRIGEITKNMGQPFCLSQIRLKLYPCCAASHSAIYALLELVKEHNIGAGDIEEVEVRCTPLMAEVLTYNKPETATEAKFSMQFPLALALSEGRVTLQEFTDEKVKDPEITALMPKVKLTPAPEMQTDDEATLPAIVEIKLKDGRRVAKRCDYPPGSPQNPLSDEELLGKYKSCARLVLPEKEIEESIEVITTLEKVDNIGKLLNLLYNQRKEPHRDYWVY